MKKIMNFLMLFLIGLTILTINVFAKTNTIYINIEKTKYQTMVQIIMILQNIIH